MSDGTATTQPTSPTEAGGLGELQTDLLAGTTHKASDLAMVRRAIRERWPIDEAKRPVIAKRLVDIVETEETTFIGQDGKPVTVTDKADTNAIQAARVLVSMDGLNQGDEHLDDKNQRLDSGKATENIAATHKFIKGVDGEAL